MPSIYTETEKKEGGRAGHLANDKSGALLLDYYLISDPLCWRELLALVVPKSVIRSIKNSSAEKFKKNHKEIKKRKGKKIRESCTVRAVKSN